MTTREQPRTFRVAEIRVLYICPCSLQTETQRDVSECSCCRPHDDENHGGTPTPRAKRNIVHVITVRGIGARFLENDQGNEEKVIAIEQRKQTAKRQRNYWVS